MQHRSLVYFREVAQTGSLHEASSRLHISTSAISRQIAKLEEQLGIGLFERRPRGMVLTAAGELLLQRTQRLAIGMEETLAELRALAGKSHGLIRIASYEGFALDCLSYAIEAFREKHPAVHFHVWVGTSPDICARIKNGAADIGITYSYPPPPDIAIEHIALRPIFAALRRDHPLAGRPSVTLDDLRGEQWAVPDEDRTQRLLLQAALAAKGIAFNPVFSTNSMAMLRAFSFSSGTTSITGSPDLLRAKDVAIALVPIEDPILATSALHILTMEGRGLPATMIRFVDALKALTPSPSL